MTDPQDAFAPPPGLPPAYGQPGFGAPYRAPTATNTLAIVSLAISLLGFCPPAGLITGFLALGQLKTSGEQGRGLAIAGIVISALTLVVFAVILVAVFASTCSGGYC